MDSQRSESSLFFIEHIAEHMPGGFFVYSALGRHELLFANRGALTIWGCESLEQLKELTENSFERMIYPDDVEAVQRSISEQIANNDGGFDHIVYRIQTRAGFVRWVDDYGHLVHTPDFGDVFYVFVADITEKRLLEEENARKNEIIEVLSNEYISILLIHLETGLVRFYRTYPSYFSLHHDACMHTGKWADVFPAYVKSFVLPEDRDLCLKELTLGHIVDRLQEESSYSFSFRQVIADGRNGARAYRRAALPFFRREPRRVLSAG